MGSCKMSNISGLSLWRDTDEEIEELKKWFYGDVTELDGKAVPNIFEHKGAPTRVEVVNE